MSGKQVRKGCAVALAVYMVLAVAFYWIAGGQLRFREERTDCVSASEPIGELVQGMEIRQPFVAAAEEIRSVDMRLSTYQRVNSVRVLVSIVDGDQAVLAQAELSGADIEDNAVRTIPFAQPAQVTPGKRYELVLTSPDGVPGNAITAWQGSTISTARAELPVEITERVLVDGAAREGMLHYSLLTRSYFWFGSYYWYLVLGLGLLLAGYGACLCRLAGQGRSSAGLRLAAAFQRYGYLMRQLVARDFKTKYKRSMLGILWSFLNPLLTMLVQYIVFSTLFQSDIPNFPLYLLSGIVCFNFFSEATAMGLQSIVGNAALITKVYVPKYIYPVSRVFSSAINLLLSLIPLLAVMLLMGTPVRPAMLLLPFGLVCLVALCIGMAFVLSTLMVFFRDTQFLWGVVSMLWMYMTPIFYPESIIPDQYMLLYKCNPLYHIIRFVRILLIDGVSPEPKAYALCLLASFVPLALGAAIFKKHQDKFILNL